MMMRLCFLFSLLCHQVSCSSLDLFAKTEMLSNGEIENNVLEKFFVGIKTAYLRENKPRHITIVGGTNEEFRQAESLLNSYPYMICKEIVKCRYSESFSRGNFVIFLLSDLSENAFERDTKFFSLCKKCKIFFAYYGNIGLEKIEMIFTLATEENMQYIEFAHITKNEILLYNNVVAKDCSMKAGLMVVWRPEISNFNKIHTWAFQLLKNLNGCPISVSALTFKPKILIEERDNDSLIITGGREGKLLLAIAEKLNFTLKLRYPSVVDRMKFSRKMSIVNDVISGIAEIGIGRILPTNDLQQLVSFSVAYDDECVTWGVPLIINSRDILWEEFPWQIWILICLVFLFTCVTEYVHINLNFIRRGKKGNPEFLKIVFDVLAVDLGNPVVYVSSSAAGSVMLILHLYYAMVITTAYKTSLASILTTDQGTPMYVDAEGIIRANIKLGGSLYDYNILKDQVNDSKLVSQLLNRYVINNNDTESMHQLKYGHEYAFLARLSSLNYQMVKMIRDHESIAFDNLKGCVLAYHTVIVFKKTSLLRIPTDGIIWRLLETGLLEYWDHADIYTDTILKSGHSGKYLRNYHTADKFRTIFILYFGCIALCWVSFFIEILIAKFKLKSKL